MQNNVEKIRLLRNLTQTELARRVGATPSTISRLEAGKRKLNQDYLNKLSKALGCEPSDLFSGAIPEVSETRLIPIVGTCDSTAWRVSYLEAATHEVIPVIPAPRFRAIDHSAYKVANAHTDICREGGYVICVPTDAIHTKPVHGDYLVVRRREGKMEQHIVVQAVVDAGGLSYQIDGERVVCTAEDWPVGRVVSVYFEV